jgi:hypothetical protein
MIIYLVLLLPTVSSGLPENTAGSRIAFYSALLRMGFTFAPLVTKQAVVSYTAFPSLPHQLLRSSIWHGGIFLLHLPWSCLHRTLSGILPYEARTFLTPNLSVDFKVYQDIL